MLLAPDPCPERDQVVAAPRLDPVTGTVEQPDRVASRALQPLAEPVDLLDQCRAVDFHPLAHPQSVEARGRKTRIEQIARFHLVQNLARGRQAATAPDKPCLRVFVDGHAIPRTPQQYGGHASRKRPSDDRRLHGTSRVGASGKNTMSPFLLIGGTGH